METLLALLLRLALTGTIGATPGGGIADEARTLPADAHCPAAARACVDTRHQIAWLQSEGEITYGPVPARLGRPGHRTPRGTFHVAWKAEDWTSTEFGIPMPYSVFFAPGGIAFHEGPLGTPSHGCVHLERTAAKRFFDRLKVGDEVVVG